MDTVVQDYLEKFGVREETQRFLVRPQSMFIGGKPGCPKATANPAR